MTSIIKQVVGAKTPITVTGLSTLAAGAYSVSATKDNTVNQPADNMVEVTGTSTNTLAGNFQLVVYAQASYDGTVWQSGPTSGTSTTDEPALTKLGYVPITTSGTPGTLSFSVAAAYGGVLPPYVRIIVKNELGVALTAGSAAICEISLTVN